MHKKANEKRLEMIRALLELSDEDIMDNTNFTFWGNDPTIVTYSHDDGKGHPPTPPPDPPPGQ